VGDQIEHEVGSDAKDAAMLGLAHGAMLLEFEIRVQVQTDPFRMPIEKAAVLWPEKLSPRVPVANLHIPKNSILRRNSNSLIGSNTRPGIASRTIARSAIRAARGSDYIRHSQTFA
jgi:hypothetical protein